MDPVTVFSLVAGVLQVVDFSLKAVDKCRELYKDGSLAEHRDTGEIAEKLGMNTPNSASMWRYCLSISF